MKLAQGGQGRKLMGDAFSVSAGVVDLVTEVPRPENRLI